VRCRHSASAVAGALVASLALHSATVRADDSADPAAPAAPATSGKLLLTGGLTPWAVIGGYGTASQLGANAHATYVHTQNYALTTYGALVGVANRVEFSIARQAFDTRDVGWQLDLGSGFKFNMDTIGAKVRLFGDAVPDQDTWIPQVSAGCDSRACAPGLRSSSWC